MFMNSDPFLIFFGLFYIIIGLSNLIIPKAWDDFIAVFGKNETTISVATGLLMLPLGLFIVVFYNNWTGFASALLMVIGYIILIKACMLLSVPGLVQKMAEKKIMVPPVWLRGVFALAIGLALLLLERL